VFLKVAVDVQSTDLMPDGILRRGATLEAIQPSAFNRRSATNSFRASIRGLKATATVTRSLRDPCGGKSGRGLPQSKTLARYSSAPLQSARFFVSGGLNFLR
jgi:hypothetical protein